MMQYKNGYGASKNALNKAMDVGKKNNNNNNDNCMGYFTLISPCNSCC